MTLLLSENKQNFELIKRFDSRLRVQGAICKLSRTQQTIRSMFATLIQRTNYEPSLFFREISSSLSWLQKLKTQIMNWTSIIHFIRIGHTPYDKLVYGMYYVLITHLFMQKPIEADIWQARSFEKKKVTSDFKNEYKFLQYFTECMYCIYL